MLAASCRKHAWLGLRTRQKTDYYRFYAVSKNSTNSLCDSRCHEYKLQLNSSIDQLINMNKIKLGSIHSTKQYEVLPLVDEFCRVDGASFAFSHIPLGPPHIPLGPFHRGT